MSEINLVKALNAYRQALFEQAFDDLLHSAHGTPPDRTKLANVGAKRREAIEAAKLVTPEQLTQCVMVALPLGDI